MRQDEILGVIDHISVSYCNRDKYKQGMLSSVKSGFRSLPETFKAALLIQGDQPMITTEAINIVIRTYRQSRHGIVIPVYQRRWGHPVLIDNKYRKQIEKL